MIAALAVHGPDQSAVRDHAQAASLSPWAVRRMGVLELHPKVTFFVGDNGCGKSTLIEAIAIAAGFNPEGGSKSFRFAAHPTESSLE
ncbi:MAG TPA: AAA family ATPase, partial [Candidatus Binatia bacterium]|nr:AAA family ATPase [Candidatus Binatia bacterium]